MTLDQCDITVTWFGPLSKRLWAHLWGVEAAEGHASVRKNWERVNGNFYVIETEKKYSTLIIQNRRGAATDFSLS